jgi:2-desacetyl-2-hydroxyethyl bacteriochlorophyllide A dehydrogenase
MQALWLENQALHFRQDVKVPEPEVGEALIQVRLTGICATDLEMANGYYPFTGVPGHEFVGVVTLAPGQPTWRGQRVVGEINIACGECTQCLAGRTSHCEKRRVLGIRDYPGAFAQYLVLPITNLHRVPDSVTDERAVFAEPLAAALEIQEQIKISPGERVLIVGAGRLGQLIAQTLALTGCDISAVVRHERQRQLLRERGVASITAEEVESGRWDLVVDASGSKEGFQLARQAVRPGGTIVLKSTFKGETELNLSAVVVDEVTLVGSRCGPFAPALRLLESGRVDPSALIDARLSLTEAEKAYQLAAQPGAFKILFDPLPQGSRSQSMG